MESSAKIYGIFARIFYELNVSAMKINWCYTFQISMDFAVKIVLIVLAIYHYYNTVSNNFMLSMEWFLSGATRIFEIIIITSVCHLTVQQVRLII